MGKIIACRVDKSDPAVGDRVVCLERPEGIDSMSDLPQMPLPQVVSKRGADEPETGAYIPPPRSARPMRTGSGDSMEFGVPSGATKPSINDLTSRLGALGSGVKISVKRLEPKLPSCESGWTDWIELSNPTPTEDDVQGAIKEKFGGGEFMIRFRSQNSQKAEEDVLKLAFAGDWIPITDEGRAIKQRQVANGGQLPLTTTSGPSLMEASSPLLQDVLATAKADKSEAREIAARSASESNNSMVQLVTALKGGDRPSERPAMDLPGLITAFSSIFVPFMTMQAESRRAADERAAAERRAAEERADRQRAESEARTERLIAEMKQSNQPSFMMKAAEGQMDFMTKLLRTTTEKSIELAMAAAGKGEDEVGPIRKALASVLESVGPNLMQMASAAIPNLLNQNAGNQQQPQQQALPQQASRQMMQAGTQQVPVFLPRTQEPVGTAPPPPPAAAPGPPPPPPPSSTTEQPAPELPPMTRADACADVFLRHLGQFAAERPDPNSTWEWVVQGMSLETILGMAPLQFRTKIESVEPENGDILPVAWAEGLHPGVIEIASKVDEILKSNPASLEWARAFLDVGAWREPEEPA